jgi:outer membrane protein assembly factor BamB
VYSSPTVAGGVVCFGAGTTNIVYANDARTGALLWKSPTLAGRAQISPMVVNGRLYVVAGGSVYAFAAEQK